ncbi:MAG: chorismate synthase [Chitinispirillales bacterium]|jgi:chorismate synthase|nr:chorismate synthase [Chitinispirillales bacterium]
MSNTFGNCFKVTTFGESHGAAVGAVIDGFPPSIPISEKDIQPQLDRRRPGQSSISTQRNEADLVEILSGVENGLSLGTPITLVVKNKDKRPGDYAQDDTVPRPSHADYTYLMKYGIKADSGGGRASGRETIGRVAAGAAAEIFLRKNFGTEIVGFVSSVGKINAKGIDFNTVTRVMVDENPVRCPDLDAAKLMEELIHEVKNEGDSIGGVITCVCKGVPAGWGEPVFGKLEAALGAAMLSIPACKGFEIGSGFEGAAMRGSEHNDLFVRRDQRNMTDRSSPLRTLTNRSGGVQGGISNGELIYFRVPFKPAATISRDQKTADYQGNEIVLKSKGRHDPCVVHRAVPVVESMAALVLADMALGQAMRNYD